MDARVALTAVSAIRRSRYAILAVWTIMLVLGAVYAQRFTANTKIDFDVPPSAKGYDAAQLFKRLFPEEDVKVTALVRRVDDGPVLGDDLENLTMDLGEWATSEGLEKEAIMGYYTMLDAGLQDLAAPFVDDPAQPSASKATLLVISLPLADADARSDALRTHLDGVTPDSLRVQLAGEPFFLKASLDGVTHDVEQVHPKVVPFAFIPFVCIVRSCRLCIITLVCIAATAASAYFVMWPISEVTDVCNFAPSMMLSAVLATSIDYSLFLLSRFREELGSSPRPERVEQALGNSLHFAGHTVLVSGSTLALCFFGLLFFPISIVSSLGLATGTTIVLSIVVNLTLLPALILTFPRFFSAVGCGCARRSSSGEHLDSEQLRNAGSDSARLGGEENSALSDPLAPPDDGQSPVAGKAGSSATSSQRCWIGISWASIRCGWLFAVAFIAIAVPCATQIAQIETSQSQQEMMPRTAEASAAYDDMVNAFGSGFLFPFKLVIAPRDGQVESEAFFDRARKLVRRAIDLSDSAADVNVTGIMLTNGQDVPFDMLHRALHADARTCRVLAQLAQRPVCKEARLAWAQFTNVGVDGYNDATATFVQLSLNMDPFSSRGNEWLRRLRIALDQAHAESGELDDIGLVGGSIAMSDSVDVVYAYFPLMVAVTLGVVFALMGVSFRSLVVPLRAVLTISLSLVITMGATWLVYGHGALDFFGWAPIAKAGSITWSSPVLSFPIMVGLGLDYDIFLLGAVSYRGLGGRPRCCGICPLSLLLALSQQTNIIGFTRDVSVPMLPCVTGRILEYRLVAYSESESIVNGVAHSGPLITAAGIIMAIAFGALLFSSSTSLNELAFLLTVSVLVDTFLVRTILVPSVMGMLGRFNWWPRRLPEPRSPLDPMPIPPADTASPGADAAAGSPGGPPDYEASAAGDLGIHPLIASRIMEHSVVESAVEGTGEAQCSDGSAQLSTCAAGNDIS